MTETQRQRILVKHVVNIEGNNIPGAFHISEDNEKAQKTAKYVIQICSLLETLKIKNYTNLVSAFFGVLM